MKAASNMVINVKKQDILYEESQGQVKAYWDRKCAYVKNKREKAS